MKCILISALMMICTDKPIYETCVKEAITAEKNITTQLAENIVSGCDDNRGCCSWKVGLDYCDDMSGFWVCKDGQLSPSCRCK